MSSPSGTPLSCDVAIVGAGLSGLAAARKLLQARPDLSVLVLEADEDRVGGRTLTKPVRCSDGETRGWCFGGSLIGKSHSRLLQLTKDLGLTISEQPQSAGKNILEIGDTIDRYEGETPNLGTLTLMDLDKGMKSLDKLSKTLMENRGSWAALDAMTLAKKIEKETWKKTSRHCFAAIAEPCFDGELDQISCLHALRIAHSAGGFLAMLSDDGVLRIEEGAQAVCTTLAEGLGSDRILLGRDVTQVADSEDSVRLTMRSGEEVTSKYVVLTLPLSIMSRIRFSPELPVPKRDLIAAASSFAASHGFMSAVTAVLTYPTAFWRSHGYSGDILSHLGNPLPGSAMPVAPVALAGEATSADGRQPALMVATGYSVEHNWPSAEARRADILAHLARFFPKAEVDGFVDYVEHDWGAAIPGGASPLPPGSAASFCDSTALLQPAGRVHFAGADFASEWIGTMEGAVQSGQRAAEEVLKRLTA